MDEGTGENAPSSTDIPVGTGSFRPTTPEERANLLALIADVGRHLKAAGLAGHVEHARRYWMDVRADVPPEDERSRGLAGHWSRDMIVAWAGIFQIPPYQDLYPVRPRGPGKKCACENARTFTATVFPWGGLLTCAGCRESWLELEREPPRPKRSSRGRPVAPPSSTRQASSEVAAIEVLLQGVESAPADGSS